MLGLMSKPCRTRALAAGAADALPGADGPPCSDRPLEAGVVMFVAVLVGRPCVELCHCAFPFLS